MIESADLTRWLVLERGAQLDYGITQREQQGRTLAVAVVLPATLLLVLICCFEMLKDLLLGELTLYQSHVITIWFTTAIGTASAFLVLRHSRRLNEQVFSEMSQRNLAEKALEANARFIGTVTNTIPAMVSYIDRDLRYRFVNRRYEKLYHMPVCQIVGKRVPELLDDEMFAKVKEKLDVAMRGHEITHEFIFGLNGAKGRHIKATYIPDFNERGEVRGLFIQNLDISQLKEVEASLVAKQEQLTALAMELALVEERERRNIAGELHDQVGQTLVLCKIRLGAIANSMEGTDDADQLRGVSGLLEGAIQNVRSVSMQLFPPLLATVGLEAALEWLGEQVKADYGIRVEFMGDGKPKQIGEEMRTVIFQTVRELLINVAKHARAQKALIVVSRVNDSISVVVEDDGIGFDISGHSLNRGRSGGFGLFNIRQKIEYLGGKLTVESAPGYGTRTTITAALQPEALGEERNGH